MAQVSLTLRPPPNVDFVHGFPGIPPAQDRPQALVKGAVELRVPQAGVKAKWVRIELRKIEKLPPGGPDSEFYDFVGPSPINLWTSPDEYGLLRSQDFPFSIRIPESIPPSVELDNRGQIGYELIATVCTKGKRGFLRKAKAVVQSVKAPITIDKHELHSTWPIYCQHEIRQLTQEGGSGIQLIVERNHTCFGPGDRIAVSATIKSDSLSAVQLIGFELALKETTRLHWNLFAGQRGRQAQKYEKIVVSGRVDVGQTLYGGTTQTTELWCTLSPSHTTPTLTAARHMDINYTCIVKAMLGNNSNVIMELPVIISNWPRSASAQAIKQIGPTINLSLIPATATGGGASTTKATASTLPLGGRTSLDTPHGNYATTGGIAARSGADEFGGVSSLGFNPGFGTTTPSRSTFGAVGGAGGPSGTAAGASAAAGTGARRPRSAGGGNRLTITNVPEGVSPDLSGGNRQSGAPTGGGGSGAQATGWISAEEEKRLYDLAQKRVEMKQGPHAAPMPLGHRSSPPPRVVSGGSGSYSGGPSTASQPLLTQPTAGVGSSQKQWLSAEEEKVALYQKAQQAAQKFQDPAAFAPPRPSSSGVGSGSGGVEGSRPTGAQLYEAAMAATRKNAALEGAAGSSLASAGGRGNSIGAGTARGSGAPVQKQYLSADQEKAAFKRYEEARRAVDLNQSGVGPAPIAYEDLFPVKADAGGGGSAFPPRATAPADEPPPFAAIPAGAASGAGAFAILSEKERLKREYEARDNAALARQQQPQNQNGFTGNRSSVSSPPPPFTPSSAPVAPLSPPPSNQYTSAIAEKEAMRRKLEEKDRAAALAAKAQRSQSPPYTSAAAPLTPRANGNGNAVGGGAAAAQARSPPVTPQSAGFRPTPQPPSSSNRVLTALEEKALLKAKYEAKDAAGYRGGRPQPPAARVNGGAPPANGGLPAYGAPPPLMPRPPAEYIQETREEDDRLKKKIGDEGYDAGSSA